MALVMEKRSDSSFVIGSFAAKTYFAELLRAVEAGSTVTITRNGHDVATIQSPQVKNNQKALAAWDKLCSVRKQITGITLENIQEWKNDGRK